MMSAPSRRRSGRLVMAKDERCERCRWWRAPDRWIGSWEHEGERRLSKKSGVRWTEPDDSCGEFAPREEGGGDGEG